MIQSQENRILDFLRQGQTLTPMTALRLFNCWALSSRCADLNKRGLKEGFHIGCIMITENNKTFGEYSMEYDSEPSGQKVFL